MLKQILKTGKIDTIADLAASIGISHKALSIVLRRAPTFYQTIEIKKKDGGKRLLRAPKGALKSIQRSVLDKILNRVPMTNYVYGFGKGKSVIENARLHSKGKYMLNVDIKNFFPSVRSSRITGVFVGIGFPKDVAVALTKLTTLDHCLPQGAPTSPYLASIALVNLDRRLALLCAKNRLIYSRYFDDITISGGKRAHEVLQKVKRIVEMERFKIHAGKLRLSGPSDDKLVTGILIQNGKLCRPEVKDLRNYILSLQRNGMNALQEDNPAKEQASLTGKVNFVMRVDPVLGAQLAEELSKIRW